MAIRKSRFLSLTTFPYGQSTALLQRVVVIGASGSGKTTLARHLAAILSVPHIELDTLHWEANWQEVPRPVLRARTRQATAAPRWVADGNYSSVRDIVWPRATAVIWLNYAFFLTFGRLLRRTLRRLVRHERLYGGNTESFRRAFLSRNSILLWTIRTHRRRRREYPQASLLPAYAHLTFWESRHPRDTEAFLEQLRFWGTIAVSCEPRP